jgi:hypothetical protein
MDNLTLPSPIASLEKLNERSIRLLADHRHLDLRTPTAQTELNLVRQLEDIPTITRQAISWLTHPKQFASQLALEDVQRISGQSHKALDRIEHLSSQFQNEPDPIFVLESSNSDSLKSEELDYLASLLEAMSLTLNAMMHAFHVARLTIDPR